MPLWASVWLLMRWLWGRVPLERVSYFVFFALVTRQNATSVGCVRPMFRILGRNWVAKKFKKQLYTIIRKTGRQSDRMIKHSVAYFILAEEWRNSTPHFIYRTNKRRAYCQTPSHCELINKSSIGNQHNIWQGNLVVIFHTLCMRYTLKRNERWIHRWLKK